MLIGISVFQLKINLKDASIEILDEIKEEKWLMENISDVEKIMEGFNELGQIIQDLDERIQRIEPLILSVDEKIENIQDEIISSQVPDNNHIMQNEKCDDDRKRDEDATHQKHDENKEILKLFEEGVFSQEIARQLNKGIGEVS